MRKTAKKPTYKIVKIDPYLKPYEPDIELRMQHYADTSRALLGDRADIGSLANGYLYFGFHRTETGWVYREWAPGADAMHLIGDFNFWNRRSHPMRPLPGGVWEIRLEGHDALRAGQHVKVQVSRGSAVFDRIPLYIRKTEAERDTGTLTGCITNDAPYKWKNTGFPRRKVQPLFIYEAHIGMAQEYEGFGTYREFADRILPRIKKQGYNAVQLMAIAEHPYYASFGYQVTNFFAPAHWYGDIEDLKYLIDTAHGMGLMVLLDLVHSHACPNIGEGLNQFDGTSTQFFLPGERGWHSAWKTCLFDYGRHEVIHFLLSNIKYWMEEYHFDGFRFDGVTSMLYHNHGLGVSFTDYSQYFSLNTNVDAVTYLQLATELIHAINPNAVAIAEDMSGMPGMCLPVRWGGLGFDYRLSMGIPDFWIRTLKEKRDEDWDIGRMWYELTTCRPQEKTVCYCESHDQALVGDKTLIFRMADAEMYTCMDRACHTPVIDRAVALYNMIRLVTVSLAGDGWLNFMGNEFGHPEWIDFPREGNGWSHKYARRQWSLAENGYLKYGLLNDFDREMLRTVHKHRVMHSRDTVNLWMDEKNKLMVFARGECVFAFNFSPDRSQEALWLPLGAVGEGEYRVVLDTDETRFGGQGRIQQNYIYHTQPDAKRGLGFAVYLPARTALVLTRTKNAREQ